MSPAKIFGIVVRSLGLMLLVYSIWYLVYGVATILGMPGPKDSYKIAYFLSGALLLIISLYFLKGAKHLIKFCYPEENI